MEAQNNNEEPRRTYDLLVYGIEKKGLKAPEATIRQSNYSLTFEPYGTTRRFNDFDGVILFQGIFENIERGGSGYGPPWIKVDCDKQQLDKRYKELNLLFEKRGFVCFILCAPFVDFANYGGAEDSDLVKVLLNYPQFYRKNFDSRVPSVNATRNEFSAFLKLYGAACSYFQNFNEKIVLHRIAAAGSHLVGFVLGNQQFFIPSLFPEKEPEKIKEYFCALTDALTSTTNKIAVEIPTWVNAFKFSEERKVIDRHAAVTSEISQLDTRLAVFERFKHVLVADGDQLVDAVTYVLREGFGFQVDETDEYREDLKIVDVERKPLVFLEVKGTNAGVKREHVNQADSHRERAKLAADFPSVLVVNTHIKNARTVDEKDRPVPGEQVVHAARNNVIILRALDLLGLLELVNKGVMSNESVLGLLQGTGGWLRAWEETTPQLLKE